WRVRHGGKGLDPTGRWRLPGAVATLTSRRDRERRTPVQPDGVMLHGTPIHADFTLAYRSPLTSMMTPTGGTMKRSATVALTEKSPSPPSSALDSPATV